MATKPTAIELRRARVRKALRAAGKLRPRLSVFRSGKNIYAQVIDDAKGVTLASASSLEKDFKAVGKKGTDKAAATVIGKLIAERAVKAGSRTSSLIAAGYLYHGRIKALADGAREGGLNF